MLVGSYVTESPTAQMSSGAISTGLLSSRLCVLVPSGPCCTGTGVCAQDVPSHRTAIAVSGPRPSAGRANPVAHVSFAAPLPPTPTRFAAATCTGVSSQPPCEGRGAADAVPVPTRPTAANVEASADTVSPRAARRRPLERAGLLDTAVLVSFI